MSKPRLRKWCLDCERFRLIQGRGLCTSCYGLNYRAGTLDLYERDSWPAKDLAEAITALKAAGYKGPQIFGVLGFRTIGAYYNSVAMLQRKGLL